MQRRCIVWTCKSCETPHDKAILKLTKRPTICRVCDTYRDFHYFASRAESRRFAELRLQERAGMIEHLQAQVTYPVIINSVRVTKYIADFVYIRDGQTIVEDVKGNKDFLTDIFKLKQKLVGAIYGVEIELIIVN